MLSTGCLLHWANDTPLAVDAALPAQVLQVYSDLKESQVVHTAWALLALIAAKWQEDTTAIEKGIAYLIAAQRDSGDWPQQHITGVFNRNCMISYSNYRCARSPGGCYDAAS